MNPTQAEAVAGIPFGWVVLAMAFFLVVYGMTIVGRSGVKIRWSKEKGFSINLISAEAPPSDPKPKE